MPNNELVTAKVNLKKPKNSKITKTLNLNLKVQEPKFRETLMMEFTDIICNPQEKMSLTREQRQKIGRLRNIDKKEISEQRDTLLKGLQKYANDEITISASDYGAYICLAAIYSGKIPHNVNWHFIIEDFPTSLFPKELVKNRPNLKVLDLSIKYTENSWIKPFPSLMSLPKYMK